MGVAKSWRFSVISANLALLQQQNGAYSGNKHKHVCWRWRSPAAQQRKPISWSLLCGLMLFGLGLISLFTGHVASDLEWSQGLIKRSFYPILDGGRREPIDIWKSKYSKIFYGCSERGRNFASAIRERSSNGYLLIAASGGLNQQRTGITDAVVVARFLNATLVVPELDHHSYWKDESEFRNIFDVDWFISSLAKDVTILKRVPDKVMRSLEKPPYTMRVPRKSPPEYYLDQVLPILLRRRVVQLTKFDYRLANDLDEELQKLRCRVNYHALRFTKPIQALGQRVVRRMRKMAKRFIAVHLRFEPDMLAFSGCYYGGGEKERNELGEIRKRWATLPDLSPLEERKRGKCPLTPHEVGLMLRALGFTNNTYLYVASGEIYGGEETLRPLRELFPNFYTKEMLANDELKPFLPFSSRLAAIDYVVCDESDVFVTNNNGNMAKILAGRRCCAFLSRNLCKAFRNCLMNRNLLRHLEALPCKTTEIKYFRIPTGDWPFRKNRNIGPEIFLRRYMGHKRTIRPNAKRLSALFMERDQMDWDTFSKKVKSCQRGFMGEPDEMRLGRGEFHEFPHSCICKRPLGYYGNKSGRDNQDEKSPQGLRKRGMGEEPVSLGDNEDDELFSD